MSLEGVYMSLPVCPIRGTIKPYRNAQGVERPTVTTVVTIAAAKLLLR
jgi:hypothetical protein